MSGFITAYTQAEGHAKPRIIAGFPLIDATAVSAARLNRLT